MKPVELVTVELDNYDMRTLVGEALIGSVLDDGDYRDNLVFNVQQIGEEGGVWRITGEFAKKETES